MKVSHLLEGKQDDVDSFVSFIYKHKSLKGKFSDYSEAEDLFDYAYQDDAKGSTLADVFADEKRIPTLAQARREALSRAKWCISNMEKDEKKEWKTKLIALANEWADKVAPQIVKTVQGFLKEGFVAEGMWVIKNKDGAEKRFKDKDSQAAKDWKESNSKKKASDLPKYSTEWWEQSKASVVPWDPIRMGNSRGDLSYDMVKKVVRDTFGRVIFDFTDNTHKPGRTIVDGVRCATITVPVMVQHKMDGEEVEEMHKFTFIRDPKNPLKFKSGQVA